MGYRNIPFDKGQTEGGFATGACLTEIIKKNNPKSIVIVIDYDSKFKLKALDAGADLFYARASSNIFKLQENIKKLFLNHS